MGPILFLIHINDIATVSDLLHLILFADDTNIFMQHKNLLTFVKVVNAELQKLSNLFISNRLSINEKNYFIIFCSANKNYNHASVNIILNSCRIEHVQHAKFLGSTLTKD